ncbi:MAG: T9SS type A sorting domain-containing protein, partial [Chitinophagaceae bacterium]
RSSDALNWNQIGSVAGAGSSQTSKKYTFIDHNLQDGDYYFRLKQVDFDGKFSYSKILIANIENKDSYFLGQNYPNPAKNHTTINFGVKEKTHINLVLYDMQGRKIKVIVNGIKEPGIYTMDVDLKNIGRGLYYYKLSSYEFNMMKRLIVN